MGNGIANAVGFGGGVITLESLITSLGGLLISPRPAVVTDGILQARTGWTRGTQPTVGDPGFDDLGWWTIGANWTISGGKGNHIAGGATYLWRSSPFIISGNRYAVGFDLDSISGGPMRAYVGGGAVSPDYNSTGRKSFDITSDNVYFYFAADSATVCSVDTFSITNLSLTGITPDIAAGTWSGRTLAQATATAQQWHSTAGAYDLILGSGDYSAITPASSVTDWTVYIPLHLTALPGAGSYYNVLGCDAGAATGVLVVDTGEWGFYPGGGAYLHGSGVTAGITHILSISKSGTTYKYRRNAGSINTVTQTAAPISKLTLGAYGSGALATNGGYKGLIVVPSVALGSTADQRILATLASLSGVTL